MCEVYFTRIAELIRAVIVKLFAYRQIHFTSEVTMNKVHVRGAVCKESFVLDDRSAKFVVC